MSDRRIFCYQRDVLFAYYSDEMRVSSSLTNYVAGEVLDPHLPPHTATTWEIDGTDVLREILDADGCRHWLLIEGANNG
ncbi:MAG: hypothetical protein GY925_20435 [Actinomycetia bacterium]|nr:hypothetical protein [Actinomycetes bacterium]